MIRKLRSGQYRLYSRKVNPKSGRRRNLGTFKSRAAARRSTSAPCNISNGIDGTIDHRLHVRPAASGARGFPEMLGEVNVVRCGGFLRHRRVSRAPFGDVVFEWRSSADRPRTRNSSGRSSADWMKNPYYVCVKIRADGSIGPEGSPTNHISFDLPTALKIRADIDECIAIVRHFRLPTAQPLT